MRKTSSDHILSIIKSSISAVPFVGGSVASLISDYIPTATQKTIEEALQILKNRLEELGNRIDTESINKDDFSEIFKSTNNTIIRSHKREKINAAVNLIINSLLKPDDPEKLSFSESDHFSRCIEQLSFGSLIVLSKAVEMTNTNFDDNLKKSLKTDDYNQRRFNFENLCKRLPQFQPSLVMGLVGELDSMNLLHRAGVPGVRTHHYGNYTIELTTIGLKFVLLLLKENESVKKEKNI